MRHIACLLFLLLSAPLLAATLTVQTESAVSLSLAQEAENAIDRAQRWIQSQPCECSNATEIILHRYALLPAGETFKLTESEWSLLQAAIPPAILPVDLKTLPATISLFLPYPKALYALQRELPSVEAPVGWREHFVRTLINTQKVTPAGGYWHDPHATLWTILTLRALLNESNQIEVTSPIQAEF